MKRKLLYTVLAIFLGLIGLLVLIVATFIIGNVIETNRYNEYIEGQNWDCFDDPERFIEHYKPLYESKIEELKQNYSIECEEKLIQEPPYGTKWEMLRYYLYNEDFTIELKVTSSGHIKATLYFYGNEELSYDYEDYEHLVNFLNDFICYASFDAKKDCNYFKVLYDKTKSEGKIAENEEFHFDDFVGSLYYYVSTARVKTGGYYYMAEFDSSVEKMNYGVEFNGLLQPIE
ncbi:MAG: hypothetical protein IJX99_05285 [Clostridia bacterium]|nr:hypothetical protein [Clostridia bacterium]